MVGKPALIALILAAVFLSGQPATAQSNTTLVSTTGQPDHSAGGRLDFDLAQTFETGNHLTGYTVTAVDIEFYAVQNAVETYRVTINETNAQGHPTREIGELSRTANLVQGSANTWTNSSGITLERHKTYAVWIHGKAVDSDSQINAVHQTVSDSEDSGRASGWSMWDRAFAKSLTATGWGNVADSAVLQIAIKGYARAANASSDLVANDGQTSTTSIDVGASATRLAAQGFRTGSNSAGYVIHTVSIDYDDTQGDEFDVSLWNVDSSGKPTTRLTADFARPRSFTSGTDLVFAAPPGTILKASDRYAVVIHPESGGIVALGRTTSNSEDVAAIGWSVDDALFARDAADAWTVDSGGHALLIRIKGDSVGHLVGNLEQGIVIAATVSSSQSRAQWFRTAGNAIVTSVEVYDASPGSEAFNVSLWTAPRGAGLPVTRLARFNRPDSFAGRGTRVFTAPDHARVTGHPNSDFAIVIESSQRVLIGATTAPGEDSGGAPNWLIGGEGATYDGSNWSLDNTSILGIRVSGYAGHPPGMPGNPSAVYIGEGKVRLDWTAADAGTSTLSGYRVEVSTDAGATWSRAGGAPGTATVYTETRAGPYNDMRYRVSAFSERGMGRASEAVRVDPMTVNLVANSGQTVGVVGPLYQDHAQAFTTGSDKNGYRVRGADIRLDNVRNEVPTFEVKIHEESGGRPGREVGTLTRATAVVDGVLNGWTTNSGIDLDPNTTYFLVIHGAGDSSDSPGDLRNTASDSEDSGGAAHWSIGDRSFHKNQTATSWTDFSQSKMIVIKGFAKFGPFPTAPTGLTAIGQGPTQINLSWTAPGRVGTSAISGYKIEVSTDGSAWTDLVADTGSAATTYAHTGLPERSTRHYRVSAINSHEVGPASDAATETANLAVSNLTQDNAGFINLGGTNAKRAQRFTTGGDGYTLLGVDIVSQDDQGDDFTAEIWTVVNNLPGARVATLTAPAGADPFKAGRLRFTAPANTALSPNTDYAVVMSLIGTEWVTLDSTTSGSEDSGAASDWSIQNGHDTESGGTWTSSASPSLLIAVRTIRDSDSQPTAAQTPTSLVSNVAQAQSDRTSVSFGLAQGFTTGANSGGYTLESVDVVSVDAAGGRFNAAVWTTDANGHPSASFASLTAPDSYTAGTLRFTAPAGTILAASTTYTVVLTTIGSDAVLYGYTDSDNEDSGAATGWSIASNYSYEIGGTWITGPLAVRIAVLGATYTPGTDATLRSLTVSPKDIDGFAHDRLSYQVGVASTVTTATVAATATDSNATVSITPADADTSTTDVHDVNLSAGRNAVTVTVTAEDGTTTGTYTVSINRGVTTDYGWKAGEDLDTLIAAGNDTATDIWSNGTTMWVADTRDDKIYAYNMSDQSRDTSKEFDTLAGEGNNRPTGIWSDGTTMWVADLDDGKIYAYRMLDKNHDTTMEFNTLIAAGNAEPTAIWSDETTMWVADNTDRKIYAYKMSDKSRDTAKDFNTLSVAGNDASDGIWSDGTTMWVADRIDNKLYAYKMSDKSRDMGKEFNTLTGAGNNEPRGIWSDGTTMWVAGTSDDKVYSYNHPVLAVSVSVDGTTLTINFNQPLGTATSLANSVFTVKKTPDGGTEETVTLSGSPDISGKTVTLTLSSAVAATDTKVKVSYTKPATGSNNKLRDVDNNEVASFTDLKANDAPVFANTTVTRSFDENTAAGQNVGAPVAATDSDTGDTLTYTLGGDDAASFDILSTSGQIRTKAGVTYDHEAKSSYSVSVSVSDGTATAMVNVTINVNDVDEPPATPAAPTVTAVTGSTTSLLVSWTAPDNAGKPEITGYDVRYLPSYSFSFSNGPQDVTGTSTTVTGLLAGTAYRFQVRATNDEGDSGWSNVSSGVGTNAADSVLVGNTAQGGLFSTHSTFSNQPAGQSFTTGGNAAGYTLASIVVVSSDTAGDAFSASVYTVDADNNPDTEHAALTSPSSHAAGPLTFTAPANTELAANTTYIVVLTPVSSSVTLDATTSDNEDAGSADNWSIENVFRTDPGTLAWRPSSSGESIRIAVHGTAKTATNPDSGPGAPGDGSQSPDPADPIYGDLAHDPRCNLPETTTLGAPDGVEVEATATQVALSWQPYRFSVGSVESGYCIWRAENSLEFRLLGFVPAQDGGPGPERYVDGDVLPSSEYSYLVRTVDFQGVSRWPGRAWALTGTELPGLSASATRSSVTLSWDDPEDDAITGYRILRRVNWGTETTLAQGVSAAATAYVDRRVSPDTAYAYRVQVLRGTEAGYPSLWVTALTLPRSSGSFTSVSEPANQDLPADTSTTGLLKLDESVTGVIESVWEEDWFAVDLTAGETYFFRLRYDGEARHGNGWLVLGEMHDADGARLDWRSFLVPCCNHQSSSAFIPNRTGRHYLPVAAYNYQVVAYSGSGVPDPLPLAYTLELHSDQVADHIGRQSALAGTGQAEVGEWTSGAFHDLDTWDDYRVELCGGRRYRIPLFYNVLTADADGVMRRPHLADGVHGYQYTEPYVLYAPHTGLYQLSIYREPGDEPDAVWEAPDNRLERDSKVFGEATYRFYVDLLEDNYTGPNRPATGSLMVIGNARVGEILTVDTSGICDADGLANRGYSYQWISNDGANDAAIPGATGSSYTIANGDVGKAISVTVSFTDNAGHSESLTSETTAAVTAAQNAPGNNPATGAPTISGTARVGEELSATTTVIEDADGLEEATFSYQWLADGEAIGAATGQTYTIGDGYVGVLLSVRVTFTDDAGNEESLTSEPTEAVVAAGLALESATVDGATLTLTFSELLNILVDLPESAFTVTVEGTARTVSDSSVSGSAVTLTLATAVVAGEAVTVGYEKPEGNSIIGDLRGRSAESFSGREVTNETAPPPLTASAGSAPASHDGSSTFTFELRFSEEPHEDSSYVTLRDHAFTVTGGSIENASRLTPGSNQGWEITVQPSGNGSVTVVLPATTDCEAEGAICTNDGRMLSNRVEVSIPGTASQQEEPQNSPATGTPAISGTAQVGRTLTVSTTGIADADGLTNVSYTYQWLADDAAISGATGSSYTLVSGDRGKAIKARVSFNDDAGNAETLTSIATAAVAAANNPATGTPTISGTAQVGQTLTVSTTGIADADGLTNATFSYQWLADDAAISGATGSSYTLVSGDRGKAIKVRVSFTDDAGNAETLTSVATAAVAPPPLTASANQVPGSHDGSSTFTFQLRFSEEPHEDFSYVTLRDHAFTVTGGSIENASRLNPPSNVGWEITVQPSGNGSVTVVLPATTDCNAQGAICTGDGRKLSAALQVVVPGTASQQQQNNPATGTPTISGTAQVGQTLTVSTTGIADADGLTNVSYTYQWLADDAAISGATGSSYTLVSGDRGKAIRVTVSFTDDAGNAETLTSVATAAVAPPPLTASASQVPGSHDGSSTFTFQLRFNEEPHEDFSYVTMRDHAFTVTGGSIQNARRLNPPSNVGWEITVQPSGDGTVTVVLPPTTDCEATGAVCTGDGRKLSNRVEFTVSGPG